MNSLRSSSHLLLGLPTRLRALILVSSPGCQLKTLLFPSFLRADVFDPFLFIFRGVDFFIGIFLERHVTILIFFESCSEPSSVSLSVLPPSSFFIHFFGALFFFVRCHFFRFVSSFRLYNQAKHLPLRCLDHLLVLQRQCQRTAGICHRRCYHHVEEAKSVTETIVFRCQFLAMFVERRPTLLSICFLIFLCFLILGRDLLPKVSRAGCFPQDFDFLCFRFVLVA